MSLWKLLPILIEPDTIFYVFGFPVTNTLLCTWIAILALVVFFFVGTRRRDMIPRGAQNFVEWTVETLRRMVEGVSGQKKGRVFFPLIATLFLFIFVGNLEDIFPGIDTIGWIKQSDIAATAHAGNCAPVLGIFPSCHPVAGFLLFGNLTQHIAPWFRPSTTDLNLNISMAILVVIFCQIAGFYTQGFFGHVSHYINVKPMFKAIIHFKGMDIFQGFVEFFVGILEIVDELARIISLSFRLFGNIFAGTAVLAIFAFVLPFAADIIFIPFELFVAFVQALVFSLLALIYLELATQSHQHEEEESVEEAEAQGRAVAAAH